MRVLVNVKVKYKKGTLVVASYRRWIETPGVAYGVAYGVAAGVRARAA